MARKKSNEVMLTTGYLVELNEPNGKQHLYKAVFAEVHRANLPKSGKPGSLDAYHLCIAELMFVAGQLFERTQRISFRSLLGGFDSFWDNLSRIVKRMGK